MSFGANDGGTIPELITASDEDGGHDPFDPAAIAMLAT